MKPPTLQCFSNCIHVTFLRLYSSKVRCIFLRLQPVQNADAESLLQALDRNISDDGTVYYVNLVGLRSDGANVMLGTRNSVLIGLKAKQPALISFHCNCHLVALIANRACKTLPDYLEDVTIQIWYFFQKSPKWYRIIEEFHAFVDSIPHKLLKAGQTRWLSLEMEQYEALLSYFRSTEERSSNITITLEKPLTKVYLSALQAFN